MRIEDFKTKQETVNIDMFEDGYISSEKRDINESEIKNIADSLYQVGQQVEIYAIKNPVTKKLHIVDGIIRLKGMQYLKQNKESYENPIKFELNTIYKAPETEKEFEFLIENWKLTFNEPRKIIK